MQVACHHTGVFPTGITVIEAALKLDSQRKVACTAHGLQACLQKKPEK